MWNSNELVIKEQVSGSPEQTLEVTEGITTILETADPTDNCEVLPPFGFKHTKSQAKGLSVNVLLDRESYLTADSVTGTLEIKCPKTKKIKLGKISVHLIGFEGRSLIRLVTRYVTKRQE